MSRAPIAKKSRRRRTPPAKSRRGRGVVTRTTVRSSSVRTVSRANPRRRAHAAVLIAKKGATTLYFDGRNFSARGKRKYFGTLAAAYSRGEELLARYPILRSYRLFAKPL